MHTIKQLQKLTQRGHSLFPKAVLEKLQHRWEKAFIDPKLKIIRVPLEDEKDRIEFDLEEALSFGFSVESLYPTSRYRLDNFPHSSPAFSPALKPLLIHFRTRRG